MKDRYYYTGQFAEMAAVTERTLRYYDRVGLLSPAHTSESGYRLYSEQDFVRLQNILALKFLGFSLDTIRVCLENGPRSLPEMLAVQKAMLREKQFHMQRVIQAIEQAERRLQSEGGEHAWEPLVETIKVMQMEQQNNWQEKYFSPEQLKKMQEISNASYSAEARQFLDSRGPWTEEDQKRATEQWNWVYSEISRLVATGADPASPEAQHWVQVRHDLLSAFTGGNPEVKEGLGQYWKNVSELPEQERPISLPRQSEEEQEFMKRVEEIYQARKQA